MTTPDAEVRELIKSVFRRYSPAADTSDGSRFDREFLTPLSSLLALPGDAPDVQTFMVDRLEQDAPELGVGIAGSPNKDVLVKVPSLLMDPIWRAFNRYRTERGGFAAPTLLTPASADDLSGNFLTDRVIAGYVVVPVRFMFQVPRDFTVSMENVARTATGLQYIPLQPAAISADEQLANPRVGSDIGSSGVLYYVDVTYVAEKPGAAYQLRDPNLIVAVDGISGLVRATNPTPSTSTYDDETPEQLADKIMQGFGSRTLDVARGAKAILMTTFPDIEAVEPVGFGDPLMERDVLTANLVYPEGENPSDYVAVGQTAIPLVPILSDPDFPTQFLYTNRVRLRVIETDPQYYNASLAEGETYVLGVDGRDRVVAEKVIRDGIAEYVLEDFFLSAYGKDAVLTSHTPQGGAPLKHALALQNSDGFGSTSPQDLVFYKFTNTWYGPVRARQTAGTYLYLDNGFSLLGCGNCAGQDLGAVSEHVIRVDGVYQWPDSFTLGSMRLALYDLGGSFHYDDLTVVAIVPAQGYPGKTEITFSGASLPTSGPGQYVFSGTWTLWSASDILAMPTAPKDHVSFVVMHPEVGFELSDLLTYKADLAWSLRHLRGVDPDNFVIEVTSIPGGILRPNTQDGYLRVPNNQVHLGGKADLYIHTRSDYTVYDGTIPEMADLLPLRSGTGNLGLFWSGTEQAPQSSVSSPQFGSMALTARNLRSASISRRVSDGFETHRVIDQSQNLQTQVLTDYDFVTAGSGVEFYLSTPYLTYDLLTPRVVRATGQDLSSGIESPWVQTGVSLESVSVGDTLRILIPRASAGTYTILEKTAGSLRLSAAPVGPVSGMTFEIYTPSPAFNLPVIRGVSASMVDSDGTRIVIPCGIPMGCYAVRDFQTSPGMQKTYGTVRVLFKDRTMFYLPVTTPFLSEGRKYYCRNQSTRMYQVPENVGDVECLLDGELNKTYFKIRARLDKVKHFLTAGTLSVSYRHVRTAEFPSGQAPVVGYTITATVDGVQKSIAFQGTSDKIPLNQASFPGGVVQQVMEAFPTIRVAVSGACLEFYSDSAFSLSGSACTVLFGGAVNNTSANAGDHTVTNVTRDPDNPTFCRVYIEDAGSVGIVGDQVTLSRLGAVAFPAELTLDPDLGLYYKDFEVEADSGDVQYELSRGDTLSLGVDDPNGEAPGEFPVYFGYHLASENPALAFSTQDQLRLLVSAIVFDGSAADVLGMSFCPARLRVDFSYESSIAAAHADSYVIRPVNRVLCADLLGKAATPCWVIGVVTYSGGSPVSVTGPALTAFIRTLLPGKYLDISAVRSLLEGYGATDFEDPTVLYRMYCGNDRKFSVAPIYDRMTADRWVQVVPELDLLGVRRV